MRPAGGTHIFVGWDHLLFVIAPAVRVAAYGIGATAWYWLIDRLVV